MEEKSPQFQKRRRFSHEVTQSPDWTVTHFQTRRAAVWIGRRFDSFRPEVSVGFNVWLLLLLFLLGHSLLRLQVWSCEFKAAREEREEARVVRMCVRGSPFGGLDFEQEIFATVRHFFQRLPNKSLYGWTLSSFPFWLQPFVVSGGSQNNIMELGKHHVLF